jgi:competence protein ComEA
MLIVWQMLTPSTDHAQAVLVPSPVAQCAPPVANTPTPSHVVVYVSGAVVAPGLYEGNASMRVGEIVALAGGLSAGAQAETLNMAEPIYDAMHIHVPNHATPGSGEVAPVQQRALNINRATASELEELPGIGPSLAQRIVAYREAHGAFADAHALRAVPGLGDALIQKILSLVVFV